MVSVQAILLGPKFGQSYTAVCTWITRTVLSKSLQFRETIRNVIPLAVLSRDAEELSGLLQAIEGL